MEQRNLLECTIDLAQPYAELTATISAVLSAIPSAEDRVSVLHALSDAITSALFTAEDEMGGGVTDGAQEEAEAGPSDISA
ncbi:hypothetical protein D3C74_329850 [compost metagenome]